jgi:hypothetical protein
MLVQCRTVICENRTNKKENLNRPIQILRGCNSETSEQTSSSRSSPFILDQTDFFINQTKMQRILTSLDIGIWNIVHMMT